MTEQYIVSFIRSKWRLLLVMGLVLGLWRLGGPLAEAVDIARVQSALEEAGPLGALGFVGVFAVGNLLSVPGLVFVIGALLAYGKVLGLVVALIGSLVALSLNFAVVRGVGGAAAPRTGSLVARALARLERSPVCTVALLRLFTVLSPPVNYALALSGVRYRDYMVGSAIGLVAPLLAYALGVDCLVASGWIQGS